MDGLNSRLKSAEEIIYELENRSKESDWFQFITYNTDIIRWKILRLRERYDRLKSTHIDQRIENDRIQTGRIERLKEIMAEDFPELMKDMIPQILEAA